MNNENSSGNKKRPITVKFMARGIVRDSNVICWLRQFPKNIPEWGNCQFSFDVDLDEYDWLAVYHDLPRKPWDISKEKLNCPKENTILITAEPSTITVYGTDYLKQFGYIITSQEPWAIRHPGAIFTQPGLIWFYGIPYPNGIPSYDGNIRNYDIIKATQPFEKTQLISTICSNRSGKLTLHDARVKFTQDLKDSFEALDVFGHGVKPFVDKAEVLDPYKYHITIENHVYAHHLTEKLPDAFLGYTLPFYHGCPNADDYFPLESFIPIDINDFDRSLDIIKSTIANNEYEDRLPYIIEARQRVLEKYNLFSVLNREITRYNTTINHTAKSDNWVMNRSTFRICNPVAGIRTLCEKVIVKSKHKFGLV